MSARCGSAPRCSVVFSIWRNSAKLAWSHYVLLAQVGDPGRRAALASQSDRCGWKVTELKQRVRTLNAARDIEVVARAVGDADTYGAPKTALGRLTPKRFVERLIAAAEGFTIVTSKVDKYDRYLADVHLRPRTGVEIFLNNVLLEHGHAVPKDPSTPAIPNPD